ncbi:hypothetical protein [Kocuria rhizophila]|uniref:phage tail tube protein n=1 Tax=Kocuria rhizophila TaxID=72000 RepID=UPI0011AABAFF|nr:hypothetical protein [Kocuria rhizophila]MCG7425053.1 hypothetical protein [Kocuria rhizophila]MCT2249372.1 hypothetical protein [Kocuria rhizophila]
MPLDAGKTIIPFRGNVLVAPVDTKPIDISSFVIGEESTYTGWDSIGHTSRENTVALEKDGGDAEQKGSWEDEGLDAVYEPTAWSSTVNALQMDRETFELAFPGGEWDEATQSYDVGNIGTVERAVLVIFAPGDKRAGFYMPRGQITLGDAPELDVEEFFELQLRIQALSSQTTRKRFRWFATRQYKALAPAQDG